MIQPRLVMRVMKLSIRWPVPRHGELIAQWHAIKPAA
jgi:hypothetical protein